VVLAGTEMPNFQRFWRGYVARDRVIRLGALSEFAKRDFFAGIDIFALPSRSDSFGLVILEAWANALPAVAYRAGGIADVIHHGDDGLLAHCGDVDGLADELDRLVIDDARRRRLGQAGKQRLPDFDWTPKLRLVREAYEALIECRQHHSTCKK
jgi:glycosyltransferase involved in cell wall biosynthesis